MKAVQECDLLLVLGTQLTTNLPSQMVECAKTKGDALVVRIDPLVEFDDPKSAGMLHLQAKTGECLPRIVNILHRLLQEPLLPPLRAPVTKVLAKAIAPKPAPKPKASVSMRRSSSKTSNSPARGRSPGTSGSGSASRSGSSSRIGIGSPQPR